MEKINGKLIITLKSDLCVGSGYSYAGIVDSDTCYDDNGLPYIPARRLRGCLRETLETLLYFKYEEEKVETCFGKSGEKQSSGFYVENAYLKNYEQIAKELSSGRESGRPEYDTQAVLDRFSHVVGQTRIDKNTGVAEDGSLRYTRVIDALSPLKENDSLIFEAVVTVPKDDEAMIADAAKATRHIGLKRNRGLGNVQIEFERIENKECFDNCIQIKEQSDGKYQLCYAFENIQPLMVSSSSEDESLGYVTGQQIIGCLAGRFLRKGNSADGKEFKDMFLNGTVIFSNAYPFDGKRVYYPAPDYLNQLKKTKEYVYTLSSELPEIADKEDSKNYIDGNQPKKLKGKYVSVENGKVRVYETKKEVVFHHSHRNTHDTENGEQGILYSFETLKKGQKFYGTITGPKNYIDEIQKLLEEDYLRIGKSKSTQYGKCKLIECGFVEEESTETNGGKNILVTFLSDTICTNEEGNPVVYQENVLEEVSKQLGIGEVRECDSYISSIQTGLVTGYLGVWNLRRPSVPVIKAGSYLTLAYDGDVLPNEKTIGERQQEGFGQIRIEWLDDKYAYDALKKAGEDETKETLAEVSESTKSLVVANAYDQWLERRISEKIGESKGSRDHAGRFILMLRESLLESEENPDVAFEKMGERIKAIKKDSTRMAGEKLLKLVGKYAGDKETGKWKISQNSEYMKDDDLLKEAIAYMGLSIQESEKKKRWAKYLMTILVDNKYKERN